MTPRSMRQGMTMMEIMVSIAILGIIGMLTWSTVGQTLAAREKLEAEDGIRQQARMALNRISHEISLAYLTSNVSSPNSYRTVFVGKDDGEIDTLWFAALSHHRIYRDARECDQTELTYWGEMDPNDSGAYVLLHREAPRIDHEPDQDGVILPLAFGVKRLDFKYLDGNTNEWAEEWDSQGVEQANRLPRAVRVILVVEGPSAQGRDETKEFTYATTVLLEYSSNLNKSAFATGSGNTVTSPLSGGNTRSLPGGGLGGGRGLPGSSR